MNERPIESREVDIDGLTFVVDIWDDYDSSPNDYPDLFTDDGDDRLSQRCRAAFRADSGYAWQYVGVSVHLPWQDADSYVAVLWAVEAGNLPSEDEHGNETWITCDPFESDYLSDLAGEAVDVWLKEFDEHADAVRAWRMNRTIARETAQ